MILPQQPVYAIVPLSGPSIESDRLLLRPITDDDAGALFVVRSRPEVAEMNHPKTPFKSIEETREWMATKVFSSGPSDIIGRSFNYAIVDKSIPETEERVIGSLSINQVDPYPEIGYAVHPSSWGKGYATEALQLMLKMWWDLERRTVDSEDAAGEAEKAFALCEKRNAASRRVLEKCGFKIVGDFQEEGHDLFIFALERP
ncbi:Acyl-CoA N-acyltransferase [Penicillium griseofulvum]|uniref:Acyl-CoA N-acyltransferase n=1 Tax=Penicillium patulum TaxID=5078 RepID=A0A135LBW8_PENPA|nr:Acyl-CoA N-acyltransferase [Penicillium griseofulvum]KXG46443.1 Acyl-CoA N-acyltransferase [Penicillium griseofulvum]